jgi:GYF domain 2
MYTIIGGDGKEYGPVNKEQVLAWIASGRANLDTLAKNEATLSWKPLREFSDFSPHGVDQTSSATPPVTATEDTSAAHANLEPKKIAENFIARGKKLEVSSCYDRAWKLVKAHFWALLGTTFLIIIVQAFINTIPVLGKFASLVIGGVFSGGLQYYYLKKIRGLPTTAGDAFSGFSLAFLPLLLGGLVGTSLTVLGFILLIIPGIYLSIAYLFTWLLIIDKKMDFWAALEVSRRVISAQWWQMFGLILLAIPFLILGLICLLVGVFVAVVLISAAIIYAYEDLCNSSSQNDVVS